VLKDVLVFRHKMKRLTAGKILLFVLAFVAMLVFKAVVAFAQDPEPEAPLAAFLQTWRGKVNAHSDIDGVGHERFGLLARDTARKV